MTYPTRIFINYLSLICYLGVFLVSCNSDEKNSIEPEKLADYELFFFKIDSIRGGDGFIPLQYIYDDFEISKIDFKDHLGIEKHNYRVSNVYKGDEFLFINIVSLISNFNSTVKVHVYETGFDAFFVDKFDRHLKLLYQKNEYDYFMIDEADIKINTSSYLNGRYVLNDYEEEQMHALFQIPTYVLLAIRELLWIDVSKKLIENVKETSMASEQRNLNCEYYPSVYVEKICTSQYLCEIDVVTELNYKCSNQYCIGCCSIHIDGDNCLFGQTACIAYGYGHMCDGFQVPEDDLVDLLCPPNKPCPIPVRG